MMSFIGLSFDGKKLDVKTKQNKKSELLEKLLILPGIFVWLFFESRGPMNLILRRKSKR